ncbi:isochorismate synthase [Desulfitobacterium metallireducens]|uniref:isochorismate synthase n=1 Tax=Desulfitobacterium metallireducens DSM 15288 TaxID=871968 RepID=W0EEG9_9FIRM|nr:isochorismate synthase [Desulfitobacterium metallireducens]AHF07913.1 isochorismate synthase [Desulfitobacterium metallireducens DSM 15288]
MIYQQKETHLKSPLSFWQNFEHEERVLFYNPLENELIIGAKRLKTFKTGESYIHFPYVFSTRTFFPTLKDQKWSGLGNETIAFEFYFVEKNGKQILYYAQDDFDIQEREFTPQTHVYKMLADDYEDWQELFYNVKQEIASGKVKKVVISREITIECETTVSIESMVKNLLEKNPSSFAFAYFKDGKTFLGATPEILVQKKQEEIMSYALAGTISRGDKEHDEEQKTALLNDPKNCHEHQIVKDYIAKVMTSFCDDVSVGATTILTLKNIHHLQTIIKAKPKENSSLTDWVFRLHPTPALGGYPVQGALDIIERCEKHERGLYAAPIGMMNEQGDGIFVAGIRSALIDGNRVYAYAGCGIVKDSECEEEYLETSNKVKTIVESL